jgi:prepilin-type N-terminal cleavage/methylation domain-containing protein/prepilin-type processing-associated H-X9-DG protein
MIDLKTRTSRRGFTLIELLVVIAIIAILAAILFPVFAQAREKARQTTCLSNLKQLGTATIMYVQDYDEHYYPHRWNSGPNSNPLMSASGVGADISGEATGKTFWISLLQPYVKSYNVFLCPDNPNGWVISNTNGQNCAGSVAGADGCGGTGYGGENSYGHNDAWVSPAGSYTAQYGGAVSPISDAQVARPSSTIMITDSTYYGVAPDVCNYSGLMTNAAPTGGGSTPTSSGTNADCTYVTGQGAQYPFYFQNIGNAVWSWGTAPSESAPAPSEIQQDVAGWQNRHQGFINCQFIDGHVKALRYADAVGNICYWSTDVNTAHPWCQ